MAHRADEITSKTATNAIAYRDPADAPQKSGGYGWHQPELVFEDEITGKGQQGFIQDRQSHNAEHEQRKEGRVAILSNPIEKGIHDVSPIASLQEWNRL